MSHYCDEGRICAYHETRLPCSICERPNDGQRPGPLCRGCRATAKSSGGAFTRERYEAAWRLKRHG